VRPTGPGPFPPICAAALCRAEHRPLAAPAGFARSRVPIALPTHHPLAVNLSPYQAWLLNTCWPLACARHCNHLPLTVPRLWTATAVSCHALSIKEHSDNGHHPPTHIPSRRRRAHPTHVAFACSARAPNWPPWRCLTTPNRPS
jgi:hypothetical protein